MAFSWNLFSNKKEINFFDKQVLELPKLVAGFLMGLVRG
jgi:hypothetical protein